VAHEIKRISKNRAQDTLRIHAAGGDQILCPHADNDDNDIDKRAAQSKLKDLRTVANLKFHAGKISSPAKIKCVERWKRWQLVIRFIMDHWN
jgi:hypothetical protein